MLIINDVSGMKEFIEKVRGKIIGLVPTMGCLHQGHLSLIRRAREQCDVVVVSIYVNPTQFAPGEDFDTYPRDFEHDRKMCEEADAIFYPDNNEMYPEGYKTYVTVEGITKVLCGRSRPAHFRGVTTVVAKLFNIIKPSMAYFGQKDYQQSLVIRRMAKDLNMDVEIVTCPTVRDRDGLAVSSRNRYLNKEQREEAAVLYSSLKLAQDLIAKGVENTDSIKDDVIKKIRTTSGIIDYVEILDKETLKPLKKIIQGSTLIALAVRFGSTRLIDNLIL